MIEVSSIFNYLGWIVAVLLGTPAALYYWRRLSKERASERAENAKRMHEVEELVRESVEQAEDYTGVPDLASVSALWFNERPWVNKRTKRVLLTLKQLADDFGFWLDLSWRLLSGTMAKAAYYAGTSSKFSQQMEQTVRGSFENLLSNNLSTRVFEGQNISIPWIRDNCPRFYEDLVKAGSQLDLQRELGKVLEPIQEVAQSKYLQIMREKRQRFLKAAEEMLAHLKSVTGDQ